MYPDSVDAVVSDTTTTDQIERGDVAPKAEPLERSYSRTKSAANQWDAHFTYDEGKVTVYIKSLSKADRTALSDKEKTLQDSAKKVQEQIAATDDLAEKQRLSEQLTDSQIAFMEDLLLQTVKGWSGIKIPFSPEAVADLPLEVMADWVPLILQKSVMGRTEADFLKNNSNV